MWITQDIFLRFRFVFNLWIILKLSFDFAPVIHMPVNSQNPLF